MTPTTRFVSTGTLPDVVRVGNLVEDAHRRFCDNVEGSLSTVYPALQRADPAHFGLCVASARGDIRGRRCRRAVLDHERRQAVRARPRVRGAGRRDRAPADRCERHGASVDSRSRSAVSDGRTNPMVNPGAIATAGMVPGDSLESADIRARRDVALAGRPLALPTR